MNNQYNGHLCIVFALEHYNPLNMIRALGENGINPVYISVKRRYEVATKSKYISELHRVDSVEEGFKCWRCGHRQLVQNSRISAMGVCRCSHSFTHSILYSLVMTAEIGRAHV